jgi:hypothetical protein
VLNTNSPVRKISHHLLHDLTQVLPDYFHFKAKFNQHTGIFAAGFKMPFAPEIFSGLF